MKVQFQAPLYLTLILCVILFSYCKGQVKPNASNQGPLVLKNQAVIDSKLHFTSMITVIFEDSKGNLWIGTHHEGLCRYSPSEKEEQNRFTYYTVDQGLPEGRIVEFDNRQVAMGNSIRYIQEDRSGNILIYTGDGLSIFDGQTFTTIPPAKQTLLITESFDYSAENYEQEWKKEREKFWFGEGQNNGVYRYDGNHLIRLTFPAKDETENKPWSKYATYSLYNDNYGNLWFGTESGGIMRYDGKSFTCINEYEKKGIVRSFFQDSSGKLWISNVTMGLYCYDHSAFLAGKNPLTNFTREKGFYNLNDIRNDHTLDKSNYLDGIQTIAEDDAGNLWFGSFSDGLWRYDGQEFTHFSTATGLPDNTVKTIFKDSKGKLWFGIGQEQANLYFFDGLSFIPF